MLYDETIDGYKHKPVHAAPGTHRWCVADGFTWPCPYEKRQQKKAGEKS